MRVARAIAIFAGLAVAAGAFAVEAVQRVASVNGVPITARELVEAQQRLRFRFEADAAGLRAAAFAECVEFQATLQLAKQRGVLAETGDAFVRAAFVAENERRAGAKAMGAPVYGPVKLTWPQFRRYWLDRIERECQAAIDREAGRESDDELRRFYAEHPALFTAPGKKVPEPFAMLEGHVRDQYRTARYRRLVREIVASAKIEREEALIAILGPGTSIESRG